MKLTLALCALAAVGMAQNRPTVISVDVAHPGAAISPRMFGVFFEDINFGADGGLYPERIKNRSFEFTDPLSAWKEILEFSRTRGELDIRTDQPLNEANPHYLRVRVYEPGYGFYNTGFRGIGVESGAEYRFSAYARGNGVTAIRATLTDEAGRELGSATLSGFNSQWKRYETTLRASATVDKARLNVYIDQAGSVDLDLVSLFPMDTWGRRPNGLRKDLVQLLADMRPGFIRFPGGCIVEGRQLANRYRWKTTVGDLAARKSILNRWNNEFDHKPAPDYFQSFGLGFYEYFQLAEDIGASPLPILNCGMACQFNSSETASVTELQEYVQDALDLIEFANGPVTSTWGKLRADMGHPAPFHMTLLGVGNEQWGPRYVERYKVFAAAIRARYPEIQLVVSSGPSPDGKPFDDLWSEWRKLGADIVDEHYYQSPEWFLAHSDRYDRYPRTGPKVFAGEYAAQTSGTARPDNRNNWAAAIAEAAFMTGLERNADVVRMASYAPLLAHAEAWQWTPDAIWFNNLRSYGTPNYYVQMLFANHTGTRLVPVTPARQDTLYTSAVLDERTHELILKAVNASPSPHSARIDLAGAKPAGPVKVTTLAAQDLQAENSFEKPRNVAPVDSSSAGLEVTLAPYSFTVLRVPLAR